MIIQVIESAKSYLPNLNEKRILEAYEFAKMAHGGQERKDGSPYITHPVKAAQILTTLRIDEDTIIAMLLHDVPEDTSHTLEEIEGKFGPKVAFLVSGITKLSKVHYRNDMENRQIESLKKLFIHSAKDPRIILMKLADRLHNMRTIEFVNPQKRIRIAKETLEIFVPIANLLGIWELKHQLEDLCFRVLHPKEFDEIDQLVKATTYQKKAVLKCTIKKVEALLKKNNIQYEIIEGRQKNLYSIYRKMLKHKKSFDEIYDIIGVRVIVKELEKCYQALGILHQHFTPKIGRLKDYIAIPKSNGYQSIHTTVFGVNGTISEFQIRTYDMHIENEYGIAAHYFYHQNNKRKSMQRKVEKKYQWVQDILALQKNISSNKQFLENLKLDIFEDRIFVFTPKGDVVDLPIGSNVIDFAYHIHSDLGMLMVNAKINGKTSPIFTTLRSGDTVLIETSEESEGPQIEWLASVKTNVAKNRIREFLKEKDKAIIINDAIKIMDERIRMLGFSGMKSLNDYQKVSAITHFMADNWEDVLFKFGNGEISLADLLRVLFTKEDLIGFESDPSDTGAYAITPEKIHNIGIIIEGRNRIGLFRDICDELVNLHVNIVTIQSLAKVVKEIERLYFLIEIVDVNQYENTMYALRKVDGVLNIKRVQTVGAVQ